MARSEQPKIVLPKNEEKKAVEELILYFEKEREEKLGNLEGLLLLNYIVEKIGPSIYNQAILAAQKYMNEKTEDLYALML